VLLVVVIAGGLTLDRLVPWGRHVVDVVVLLVFASLVTASDRRGRLALLACLSFATAGELFLSLVWGLYDYRAGGVPWFVPPGHALLLCLGLTWAPHLSPRAAWLLPAAALPFVLVLFCSGHDRFGGALFAVFALALLRARTRSLYAGMFVLALGLELYGTWIGCWRWRDVVPWLGLPTTNPPLAAGTFYCLLDVLVMTTVALTSNRGRCPTSTPATAPTNASIGRSPRSA
jgi:hypothetical protein